MSPLSDKQVYRLSLMSIVRRLSNDFSPPRNSLVEVAEIIAQGLAAD